MEWFGPAPFSPACLDNPRAATPVGTACAYCEEPVIEGESGYLVPYVGEGAVTQVAYHVECLLRSTLGSVAHLERRCSCYVPGAEEGDPPGMTRRQGAKAAEHLLHADFLGRLHAVPAAPATPGPMPFDGVHDIRRAALRKRAEEDE